MPEENRGFRRDKALIVWNKMESEIRRQRESRQGRPPHLTEPSNVTAVKSEIIVSLALYMLSFFVTARDPIKKTIKKGRRETAFFYK